MLAFCFDAASELELAAGRDVAALLAPALAPYLVELGFSSSGPTGRTDSRQQTVTKVLGNTV